MLKTPIAKFAVLLCKEKECEDEQEWVPKRSLYEWHWRLKTQTRFRGVVTARSIPIGYVNPDVTGAFTSFTPTQVDALPEVVEAVRGSGVEVYLDGGVRRGTDVLKALALGARAVFIGRPVLWGLAYDVGIQYSWPILGRFRIRPSHTKPENTGCGLSGNSKTYFSRKYRVFTKSLGLKACFYMPLTFGQSREI